LAILTTAGLGGHAYYDKHKRVDGYCRILVIVRKRIVINAKARIVAVYKLKYLAFLIFSNKSQSKAGTYFYEK